MKQSAQGWEVGKVSQTVEGGTVNKEAKDPQLVPSGPLLMVSLEKPLTCPLLHFSRHLTFHPVG